MFHRHPRRDFRVPFAVSGGPTAGLVSYWPFNDGSGTTFVDTISSFNGTVSAGVTWGSGFVELDSAHTGTVPHQSAFNTGGTVTAFGWILAAPASNQSSNVIFSLYDFGTTQRAWLVGVEAAGGFNTIRVVLSDDGTLSAGHSKDYSGSQIALDSTWHSFAFRFNGGVLDLFVDGVKDSSVTKTTDDAITTIFSSNAALAFGAILNSGSPASPFNGQVQRFRLYNITKTDADIAAIHALGHA
jgi:hypothetical protein